MRFLQSFEIHSPLFRTLFIDALSKFSMRRGRFSILNLFLLCLAALLFTFSASRAQVSGEMLIGKAYEVLPDVTTFHLLPSVIKDDTPGVLVYSGPLNSLGIFALESGRLRELKRGDPRAYVGKAAVFSHSGSKKIAVAYEYGRAGAKAKRKYRNKVKVLLYNTDLQRPEVIFDQDTLGSALVTHLESVEDKLFINFYHSDSYTTGGFIAQSEQGKWGFRRHITGRERRGIDFNSSDILVSSPYSDDDERGHSLQLYRGAAAIELEALRGVSTAKFAQLDDDAELEIIACDGLPNKMQKRVNTRLVVYDYNTDTDRYTARLVSKVQNLQGSIQKMEMIKTPKGQLLLAAGRQFLNAYLPADNWQRKQVYRKDRRYIKKKLDFAVLKTSQENLILAVQDGPELKVFRVALDKIF